MDSGGAKGRNMPYKIILEDAPNCACGCGNPVGYSTERGFWKYASHRCYLKAKAATRICKRCGSTRTRAGTGYLPCKACRAARNRVKKYGITFEQAIAMPETCELCKSRPVKGLDHNHTTKSNRDWLCGQCNSGIGFFLEDPELLRRAAEYIERWQQ